MGLLNITGDEGKISKFLKLMEGFNIVDLTRTGKIAMPVPTELGDDA